VNGTRPTYPPRSAMECECGANCGRGEPFDARDAATARNAVEGEVVVSPIAAVGGRV
jgi:hypothetical protein